MGVPMRVTVWIDSENHDHRYEIELFRDADSDEELGDPYCEEPPVMLPGDSLKEILSRAESQAERKWDCFLTDSD